jgi:hypothetical protein
MNQTGSNPSSGMQPQKHGTNNTNNMSSVQLNHMEQNQQHTMPKTDINDSEHMNPTTSHHSKTQTEMVGGHH